MSPKKQPISKQKRSSDVIPQSTPSKRSKEDDQPKNTTSKPSTSFIEQNKSDEKQRFSSSVSEVQCNVDISNDQFTNFELTHISTLNPFQSKWKIQVKILRKRPIFNWSNKNGSGKLFNMDVIDQSAQIRVIGFNDVVDKFYEKFDCESIYMIANGEIKPTNKKFSTIKHNFEIHLSNDTIIQKIEDIEFEIPNVEVTYTNISEIKKLPPNSMFNVIGICYEIRGIQELQSKNNSKIYTKRDIILIDQSNETIPLSLWNQDADNFDESRIRSVISLLNVQVSEYGDRKSISIMRDSSMEYNLDIPIAKSLLTWFENKNHILHDILSKNEMKNIECIALKEVLEMSAMSTINILGICFDIGLLKIFTSDKSNKELKKRDITVIDTSAVPMKVTLWNNEAVEFDDRYIDTVVSLKNGQLMKKNNVTFITNTPETIIIHKPNVSEANALQNWYDNDGKTHIQKKILSMALYECE